MEAVVNLVELNKFKKMQVGIITSLHDNYHFSPKTTLLAYIQDHALHG